MAAVSLCGDESDVPARPESSIIVAREPIVSATENIVSVPDRLERLRVCDTCWRLATLAGMGVADAARLCAVLLVGCIEDKYIFG